MASLFSPCTALSLLVTEKQKPEVLANVLNTFSPLDIISLFSVSKYAQGFYLLRKIKATFRPATLQVQAPFSSQSLV